MDFSDYQDQLFRHGPDGAHSTMPEYGRAALCLQIRSARISEDVNAAMGIGHMTDEAGEAIVHHMGLVLRTMAHFAELLGVSLDEVAAADLAAFREGQG